MESTQSLLSEDEDEKAKIGDEGDSSEDESHPMETDPDAPGDAFPPTIEDSVEAEVGSQFQSLVIEDAIPDHFKNAIRYLIPGASWLISAASY